MNVRWIIGRAGSGKTQHCLDEVRQRLLDKPDGPPLILLVPEQATFQAEYALVNSPGLRGMIRVQAISFHRLAWRIMQEEGGTARVPIDEVGKKLLLHKILHKHRRQLRYFHNGIDQMGFTSKLIELVTELKRYEVTPHNLEAYSAGGGQGDGSRWLQDKLHDLQLIYEELETELSKQYLDGEDVLKLLITQLERSAYIRSAEIWIDGFHGFTPMELAVVEQLIRCAASVTITLSLDRMVEADETIDELELFHKPARTCAELQQRIRALGVTKAEIITLTGDPLPRYRHSPMLAHLERNFERRFGRNAPAYTAGAGAAYEQIAIRAAVHRRAEVEGAARDMVRLAREEGVRWKDMAVMVRSMEGYRELLETTLTDYGIPHFIDEKRPVLHHPLVELIRSALEVVLHGWPYDAVFRCVKTGLLLPLEEAADHIPFSPEELLEGMFKLENFVLAYGVIGSRWTDGKPWSYRKRAGLEEQTAVTAREQRESQLLEACRLLVVSALQPFERRMKAASTIRAKTEALMGLLLGLLVPETLEQWSEAALRAGIPEKAREHSQLWGAVMDMLDQLVELLGDEEAPLELYASLLDEGLESIKLGLVPPSLDQVLIGSMDRTRSGEVKYAYLLGVSDGIVPAKLSEDGLLTEAERDMLAGRGIRLAEDSRRKLLDEQFLIYNALSVPSRRLWISYPLADEEGKAQLPSEIVPQLKPLFPQLAEQLLLSEPNPADTDDMQAAYATRPGRTISHLSVQLKQWLQGEPISPVWWTVYNWFISRPEWHDRLAAVAGALFYSNRETGLSDETSLALYGQRLLASVSRMETFAACPFAHYVSYGLRLQERRMFRLEAPDIGQLFHATLNQFARQLQEEGLAWGALPAADIAKRTQHLVDSLAPELQGQILLSSSRFGYISHKLKSIIGRAATALGEQARRAEFVPLGLEVDFGPDRPLPALTFQLPNGRIMDIVGRIDRVDSAELDDKLLLRVIDYKSGSTALGLSEVLYGLSLQMLTYLDVIVSNAGTWLGRSAEPAGVLYFHVHNPLILHKNRPQHAEAEKNLRKRFKMRGLVTEDAEIVRKMDGELRTRSGYSDVIPVALKADGGFYSSSSVATPQQWERLRREVRGHIRRIGTDITDGKVDVSPYRLGKQTACQHCSYRSVCQFEPLHEDGGYRRLQPLGKEAIWHKLEGSDA